jgi:hypothetical protein
MVLCSVASLILGLGESEPHGSRSTWQRKTHLMVDRKQREGVMDLGEDIDPQGPTSRDLFLPCRPRLQKFPLLPKITPPAGTQPSSTSAIGEHFLSKP